MSNIQVQDKQLLAAVNAIRETIEKQSKTLHPNTPMTNDDIYEYLNKRIAAHKITKAMQDGEIENCIHMGIKLVALKKHVDEWIERIFKMAQPGSAAGYEIIPIKYKKSLLRKAGI